jgi:hypothetical protein
MSHSSAVFKCEIAPLLAIQETKIWRPQAAWSRLCHSIALRGIRTKVILASPQLEHFCAMQHEDQTHLDVGGEKSGKR